MKKRQMQNHDLKVVGICELYQSALGVLDFICRTNTWSGRNLAAASQLMIETSGSIIYQKKN
jgi:hypothetical protein